jgi:hypothetical protein
MSAYRRISSRLIPLDPARSVGASGEAANKKHHRVGVKDTMLTAFGPFGDKLSHKEHKEHKGSTFDYFLCSM